jgi:hypothetical protein
MTSREKYNISFLQDGGVTTKACYCCSCVPSLCKEQLCGLYFPFLNEDIYEIMSHKHNLQPLISHRDLSLPSLVMEQLCNHILISHSL